MSTNQAQPYTPTTEEVRARFVFDPVAYPEQDYAAEGGFDRWLRAHDAEVIEKAARMLESVAAVPWTRHGPSAAILRNYAAALRRGGEE